MNTAEFDQLAEELEGYKFLRIENTKKSAPTLVSLQADLGELLSELDKLTSGITGGEGQKA